MLISGKALAFYPYLCVLTDHENECTNASERYSVQITAATTDSARIRCKKRARNRGDKYCFNLDFFDRAYKRCARDNTDLNFECELRKLSPRGTSPYYKKIKATSEREAIKICQDYVKDRKEFRFFDRVLADCD